MYNKTIWQDLPSQATPVNASNLNKIENELNKTDNIIGIDEYDETLTYNIGDKRTYNEILYQCTTQISTPEEFNSSHWTQISLLEILNTMLSIITLTTERGNIKIADSLRIEWGTINVTTPASGATDYTITFPTPFSQTPAVFIQSIGNYNTHAQVNNASTTSVLARCRSLDSTEHTSRAFYWFAIGKA